MNILKNNLFATIKSIIHGLLNNPRMNLYAVVMVAILFSLATVYWQVHFLYFDLNGGGQSVFHNAVLQGTAKSPHQFRVLAEYLVEGFIRFFSWMDFPNATVAAFIIFRQFQNFLIFVCAYFYYRRLRLSSAQALMGLCILSWGMINAVYNSDLQFNTYFDILFYLLAGLAILQEKPLSIIPISILAAFNRETSGLIPIMLLAAQYRTGKSKNSVDRRGYHLPVILSGDLPWFADVFRSAGADPGIRPHAGFRSPLVQPW
jgi:hypothetical protein